MVKLYDLRRDRMSRRWLGPPQNLLIDGVYIEIILYTKGLFDANAGGRADRQVNCKWVQVISERQ